MTLPKCAKFNSQRELSDWLEEFKVTKKVKKTLCGVTEKNVMLTFGVNLYLL